MLKSAPAFHTEQPIEQVVNRLVECRGLLVITNISMQSTLFLNKSITVKIAEPANE